MIDLDNANIAVIGLGYVGLPLAVEFGRQYPTVGFDTDQERVAALKLGNDSTQEVAGDDFAAAELLSITSDLNEIRDCNVFVVTVPTPIDAFKRPDLSPLILASETVGQVIACGDVVIFESTVYPGATEEDCIPVIEQISGLAFNKDFTAGYSPERINPGDRSHRLPDIVKVTSGSTPEAAIFVDSLYSSIIRAGTHLAPSIRVAEAAKVIENTQRDVNIALVNELAIIFHKLGLDTGDVLAAAGTKWNFLPFKPGLVGGHCIGVDPYYLTHKAQEVGYQPEIILAGRRINDAMGEVVTSKLVKGMIKKGIRLLNSNVLIMGLAFKENCPDLRNTKVTDVVSELLEYGVHVHVYDPRVDADEAQSKFGITLLDTPKPGSYDAIVLAVAHDEFVAMGPNAVRRFGCDNCVVFDLKHVLPSNDADLRL
ncbi:MAG: nucleotide sugar dehydrogenase [Rhodobacteraceae bacterium]|nr:nucleotide sugar dehydrogenase [Paracoccaceae bacterium]